jgi:hypothetical protein
MWRVWLSLPEPDRVSAQGGQDLAGWKISMLTNRLAGGEFPRKQTNEVRYD